jgi:RNA polymerase primary sigma factor
MKTFRIKQKITVRNSDTISKYFKEISKIPLLFPDEEARLALKASKGNLSAREKLINANLRFVVSVAKQYQNQGLSLEELIQEGNLGLIKAIEKYDVTKGFRLISYAVWHIRQSILSALAQHARIVRLPMNRVQDVQKVNQAQERLEKTFHRRPSAEEISEALEGLSPQEVEETLSFSRYDSVSLDSTPEPNEKEKSLALIERLDNSQALAPDEGLQNQSLNADIERCLEGLAPKEAQVIRLYYGMGQEDPHTLEEIGKKFDLTRERVRQIKEKAIRRLRTSNRARLLREHLG